MLVNGLKSEAESSPDSGQQKKLLAAAKLLADATAKMVEAAKVCLRQLSLISYWPTQPPRWLRPQRFVSDSCL